MAELSGQLLGLIAFSIVVGTFAVVLIAIFRPEQLPIIAALIKSIINKALNRPDSSTKLPIVKRKRKNDETDLDS